VWKRKLFHRRDQIATAELRIKRWKRLKPDYSAVEKYDDAILKLDDEEKFQTSLTSCGVLGNSTLKRHRDYESHFPLQQAPYG
jgi:hypothetical protein